MNLYTIGFTQKTAKDFFEAVSRHKILTLIDIRLNNNSQLAGFTKGCDLGYFLKRLCGCRYEYCPAYAPSHEILDAWRKKEISWKDYEVRYTALMQERGAVQDFRRKFMRRKNVCLLCSEHTPEHCHRRLLAEMLSEEINGIEVTHIK